MTPQRPRRLPGLCHGLMLDLTERITYGTHNHNHALLCPTFYTLAGRPLCACRAQLLCTNISTRVHLQVWYLHSRCVYLHACVCPAPASAASCVALVSSSAAFCFRSSPSDAALCTVPFTALCAARPSARCEYARGEECTADALSYMTYTTPSKHAN